jgi:hypothetical protein
MRYVRAMSAYGELLSYPNKQSHDWYQKSILDIPMGAIIRQTFRMRCVFFVILGVI